ncbi:esterase-like activity of phytase family protein [Aeoliella sp.]|uniref:esterase-like activity of phytase family protein n=1 Tax=Aeoliella sp. TaxID=2795800 RepID=UPI003CCC0C7B
MEFATCNCVTTYGVAWDLTAGSFVAGNRNVAPLRQLALLVLALFWWFAPPSPAAWTIVPRGSVVLDSGGVSGVAEMSGVTNLGAINGVHQFAAAQDSGGQVVRFAASFSSSGAIQSATATSALPLGIDLDFEGIAFTNPTRNSVFLSEESTPALREYSLADGTHLQSDLPPLVYGQRRNNRALESLTRSVGGTRMWTANEEALLVDGPASTSTASTTVRLQQYDVSGNEFTASRQFAYEVDPIHGGTNADTRSGLSDLVLMPNGSLLALERSLAVAIPPFQSRIYEVDLAGATDTSDAAFDSGLEGETFTPASKTLLWSGQAGGGFGQNLEGLALGPKLADGSWVLVGVVDSGDSLSSNTVVAFQAIPPSCMLAGDYDCSGLVDAEDYQSWRDTFGSTELLFADGNGDGQVNLADYTVWRNNLGASASTATAVVVPEPSAVGPALVLVVGATLAGTTRPPLGRGGTALGTPLRR